MRLSRSTKIANVAVLISLCFAGCKYVPKNSRPELSEGIETFISRSGEKEIHFAFNEKDAGNLPSWSPSLLSQVSLDKLVEIASKELPKYSKGISGWEFEAVTLNRLHSGALKDKCIFLVRFTRENTQGGIEIPVTMNGAPILGTEHDLDKSRWEHKE
jgi:hypothetical protein